MVITYSIDIKPEPHQVAEVFQTSGIRRPVDDLNRIKKMIDNANLIITAWDGQKLVGILRGFSDFSYTCYISDIAVNKDYHNNGIGQDMIHKVEDIVNGECSIVLIASPDAAEYYEMLGFERVENAWVIHRKK